MDVWEVDAWQVELYRRAGLDPDEPAWMLNLARGLGLEVELVRCWSYPGDARLLHLPGGYRIQIKASLDLQRKRWAVAHECAEWGLRKAIDESIEVACEAVAAALLMPRSAFVRRTLDVGRDDPEQLALPFGVSQTAALLRLGEVMDLPLAVARPGLLRTRGPREFVWPSEAEVRRWAFGDARPGLHKVAITDEPRRAALVGDEQLAFGITLDADGTSGW